MIGELLLCENTLVMDSAPLPAYLEMVARDGQVTRTRTRAGCHTRDGLAGTGHRAHSRNSGATVVTPDSDKRTELVRGRLIVSEPPGFLHGDITVRVATAMANFVREASLLSSMPLGRVVAGDPGFWIERNPDTVRAPDVALVRQERLPDAVPIGFAPFAPDLAVEVLSPGDRASEGLAKVADWLAAGAELVWLIDPARRVARVYRADGTEAIMDSTASLDGEELLPGPRLPLGELFD